MKESQGLFSVSYALSHNVSPVLWLYPCLSLVKTSRKHVTLVFQQYLSINVICSLSQRIINDFCFSKAHFTMSQHHLF